MQTIGNIMLTADKARRAACAANDDFIDLRERVSAGIEIRKDDDNEKGQDPKVDSVPQGQAPGSVQCSEA
jgi:hypothetical protein